MLVAIGHEVSFWVQASHRNEEPAHFNADLAQIWGLHIFVDVGLVEASQKG